MGHGHALTIDFAIRVVSGAVARALHHKTEKFSLSAVGGKFSSTTKERKAMTSKSSFLRRITQAALLAMVGGFLSTAPASAVAYEATVSGTCVYRNTPAGLGVGGFLNISFTKQNASGAANAGRIGVSEYTYENDLLTYGVVHTSLSGNVLRSTTSLDSNTSTIAMPIADTHTYYAKSVTYQVWLSPDGTNLGTTPADSAAVSYVKCNAAGAPASYSLSATTATKNQGETATFTVTPKDAAGNTTILGFNNETITVEVSATAGTANLQAGKLNGASGNLAGISAGGAALGEYINTETSTHTLSRKGSNSGGAVMVDTGTISTIVSARMPATTGTTTKGTIRLASFHADALPTRGITTQESATATGAYTLNVRNSSAATTTVSVTGTGASAAATMTLTTESSVYGKFYGFGSKAAVTAAGFGITTGNVYATTGANLTAPSAAYPDGVSVSGASAGTATRSYQVSTARTSIPITWNLSANGVFSYTVAAITGYPLPSGITAATNTITPAGTETITSVTFTTTAPVAGQAFKVTWSFDDNVTRTASFYYEAPQVGSSRGDIVLTNTESSKKIAAGGTASAEATVTDQFGGLVSGATVLWSVSGRNTVNATSATTNTSGKSTFSWTDSNAAIVATAITDTVRAEVTYGNTGNYDNATSAYTIVASLAATTVTALSGDSDGEITADDDSVSFTVTVRDATAAALSGYPVTVSGFTNTYTTGTGVVYTSASGTVTFTAYGKKVGTETLTFTSGGKSATGTVDVVAGASRTYSIDKATVAMAPGEEPVVTATVLDQYGNAVADQAVTVTYLGAGGVAKVNGVQASSGTTDANGKVAITLGASAAGTGTLTVKATMANASTATTRGDGTAMPAKTAATGFTSAVTITGSSAAVSAAEAATDAAAEAIDAANAATDAANLAAEAADAATVAAEEARDAADAATAAVEELATQVATLMAALKAQITTLANTVAKIAKKVKA